MIQYRLAGRRVREHSSQDDPGFNEPTLPTGQRVVFNGRGFVTAGQQH